MILSLKSKNQTLVATKQQDMEEEEGNIGDTDESDGEEVDLARDQRADESLRLLRLKSLQESKRV